MDNGYYAACAGFRTQSQALEVIANNLANLNTSGYRGETPTFASLLAQSRGEPVTAFTRAIKDFSVPGSTHVDLSPGSLETTGNPFDLGIEGNGFFAVQTPAGTLYTRNGGFHVSLAGQLTTAQGDLVLGEQGPIAVPAGNVSISADGTLSVNGAVAGKLRLVEFSNRTPLTPVGTSYYSAPAGAAQPSAASAVRQGMIESSNVSPVSAVVGLIAVQRRADMLERALSAFQNDFNRIAVEDLPRV